MVSGARAEDVLGNSFFIQISQTNPGGLQRDAGWGPCHLEEAESVLTS